MTSYLPKPPISRLNKAHPLAQGLVLAMPLYEGSGGVVNDISGKENHGVITDVVWSNTPYGKGLHFNGTNDYVKVNNNSSLDFEAGFTVFALAKPTYTDDETRIFYRYDSISKDGYYLAQRPDGSGIWGFAIWVNGAWDIASSDSPPSGNWQQIVGVRETDGTLNLYVDGVLQSSPGSNPGAIDSSGDLYIGVDVDMNADYEGAMANLLIWNRALSQSEIAQLNNDPFSIYRPFYTIPRYADYDKPILWRIVDKLKSLIQSYMTQANGFSLDYGSVDQYNPALRLYPAVFIEHPESEALEDDFQVIERDSETTELKIKVMAETTADLDKTAYWIVNDFGFLFESFKGALKIEGLEQYDLVNSEVEFKNIGQYPVEVSMIYRLKYRRQNAALYTPDTSDTAETFSGSAFSSSKPIIMRIMDDIESKIGSMTIANGYKFDYGSIDEYDPSSRTYPAVFLRYNEETALEEDEGIIGFYEASTRLEIHVLAPVPADVDLKMLHVRTDFQKMFKDNWASLNGNGMERAEYVNSENKYRLVNQYPWEMILNYNLYHRRLKANPYHA